MSIVRISEPTRKSFGKDKNGWSVTRLVAQYKCDCGMIFEMQCRSEKVTQSCGCFAKQTARDLLTGNTTRCTHNMSSSREYKSFSTMHQRCSNTKHIEFARYGGRGIKVCERWKSFENFLADMGERPQGTSLDRINVNLDYSPENCRWATSEQQANNTRSNVNIEIDGMTKTVAQWAKHLGVDAKTIYARLKRGWSSREAVYGRDLYV